VLHGVPDQRIEVGVGGSSARAGAAPSAAMTARTASRPAARGLGKFELRPARAANETDMKHLRDFEKEGSKRRR
jgi:hypothetical protein